MPVQESQAHRRRPPRKCKSCRISILGIQQSEKKSSNFEAAHKIETDVYGLFLCFEDADQTAVLFDTYNGAGT